MDEEKREEQAQNTAEEAVRPRLEKADLILSLIAVLLCGCVLSGAIPAAWIFLASAALFAYVVVAVRNVGAVIQILLVSVIVTAVTFLPVVGTAVLALIIGAGALAWLFLTLPKCKWAPVALLAVAYGLGFLVTSNPVTPLLCLTFLPAAILLAWSHARDIGRTNTIIHTFLGFLISILAALCVVLWRAYGSINYDILMRFIDEIKQLFVTIVGEMGKMLWEALEAASAQAPLPAETMQKLKEAYEVAFAEGNLRVIADAVVGLTPALITAPGLILSYLADVVLLRKYYNTEWRMQMTPAACTLTVSPATGVVYTICFVIILFATKQSVFLMTVNNLFLILLPGLFLTGVNVVLHGARRARGWQGVVSILLLVAAFCCMGISGFYFIALWGAYTTVAAALHQKMLQKLKEKNDK